MPVLTILTIKFSYRDLGKWYIFCRSDISETTPPRTNERRPISRWINMTEQPSSAKGKSSLFCNSIVRWVVVVALPVIGLDAFAWSPGRVPMDSQPRNQVTPALDHRTGSLRRFPFFWEVDHQASFVVKFYDTTVSCTRLSMARTRGLEKRQEGPTPTGTLKNFKIFYFGSLWHSLHRLKYP
jgi:hypothetical protein